MVKIKRALVTGVTGQDGAYLTKLLLEKGYKVYGTYRRVSTPNFWRLQHAGVLDKITLIPADLADKASLLEAVTLAKPKIIFNLAAQSYVGSSFDQPILTTHVDGLGTTHFLEIIRHIDPNIRFYQASTSEMYGSAKEEFKNEKTPLIPNSPYGAVKVYSFHMTRVYRHAYDLFACNGILFNHETIASFMPMFCKSKGEEEFDIRPICEIVEFDQQKKYYQSRKVSGMQVWDKKGWTDVTFASAYPHDVKGDNKKPRFINSRSGAFMATSSHVAIMENSEEKKVGSIATGDKLEIIDLPEKNSHKESISEEEAELMGMMVGDGSITRYNNKKNINAKFTNSSKSIRERFSHLWIKVTNGKTSYYPSRSGFNPNKIVGQLRLVGGNSWLRKLDIYNKDKTKRIPKAVLNSSKKIMLAFLKGYNITDGLKSNPCTYEFRNFKTNSATLAMGLWYLIYTTTGQDINLTLEIKEDGRIFYSLNVLTTAKNAEKEDMVKGLLNKGFSQRGTARESKISRTFIRKIQHGGHACTVHHLKKDPAEVKKIIDLPMYGGWFYDLQTSSGTFHCGIGRCRVHNSPLRGLEFVTRKVSNAVARIKLGLQKELKMGNIETTRDWGFAPDYVRAMYMMMKHDKPDDYVIATGECHTVREFINEAFNHAGLNPKDYVKIDKTLYRPMDLGHLRGDASKAREVLGWKPKVKFKELVKIMVKADIDRWQKYLNGEMIPWDAPAYPDNIEILSRHPKRIFY